MKAIEASSAKQSNAETINRNKAMIKSNEFRPGSLIQSGKGIYRVYAVSARQVLAIQDYKEPIDSEQKVYPADNAIINPIPITEEWLVRLGFEKRDKEFYKDGFFYLIYGGGNGWKTWLNLCKDDFTLALVGQVHELQNLIYALTGEELTANDLNK